VARSNPIICIGFASIKKQAFVSGKYCHSFIAAIVEQIGRPATSNATSIHIDRPRSPPQHVGRDILLRQRLAGKDEKFDCRF